MLDEIGCPNKDFKNFFINYYFNIHIRTGRNGTEAVRKKFT